MYSWEIDKEIKEKNNVLNADRMNDIRKESCQVKVIELVRIEDSFFVYRMSTDDGYTWEIEVKKIF